MSFNYQNKGTDNYTYYRLNYTLSSVKNDTGINFRASDANNYANEWGHLQMTGHITLMDL
jgi:hypothetical protein